MGDVPKAALTSAGWGEAGAWVDSRARWELGRSTNEGLQGKRRTTLEWGWRGLHGRLHTHLPSLPADQFLQLPPPHPLECCPTGPVKEPDPNCCKGSGRPPSRRRAAAGLTAAALPLLVGAARDTAAAITRLCVLAQALGAFLPEPSSGPAGKRAGREAGTSSFSSCSRPPLHIAGRVGPQLTRP